jgi:hypothetical protein
MLIDRNLQGTYRLRFTVSASCYSRGVNWRPASHCGPSEFCQHPVELFKTTVVNRRATERIKMLNWKEPQKCLLKRRAKFPGPLPKFVSRHILVSFPKFIKFVAFLNSCFYSRTKKNSESSVSRNALFVSSANVATL